MGGVPKAASCGVCRAATSQVLGAAGIAERLISNSSVPSAGDADLGWSLSIGAGRDWSLQRLGLHDHLQLWD